MQFIKAKQVQKGPDVVTLSLKGDMKDSDYAYEDSDLSDGRLEEKEVQEVLILLDSILGERGALTDFDSQEGIDELLKKAWYIHFPSNPSGETCHTLVDMNLYINGELYLMQEEYGDDSADAILNKYSGEEDYDDED